MPAPSPVPIYRSKASPSLRSTSQQSSHTFSYDATPYSLNTVLAAAIQFLTPLCSSFENLVPQSSEILLAFIRQLDQHADNFEDAIEDSSFMFIAPVHPLLENDLFFPENGPNFWEYELLQQFIDSHLTMRHNLGFYQEQSTATDPQASSTVQLLSNHLEESMLGALPPLPALEPTNPYQLSPFKQLIFTAFQNHRQTIRDTIIAAATSNSHDSFLPLESQHEIQALLESPEHIALRPVQSDSQRNQSWAERMVTQNSASISSPSSSSPSSSSSHIISSQRQHHSDTRNGNAHHKINNRSSNSSINRANQQQNNQFEEQMKLFYSTQLILNGPHMWSNVRIGFLAQHPYLLSLYMANCQHDESVFFSAAQSVASLNRDTDICAIWNLHDVIGKRRVYTPADDALFVRALYYTENLKRYSYLSAFEEWTTDQSTLLEQQYGQMLENLVTEEKDAIAIRKRVALAHRLYPDGVSWSGLPNAEDQQADWLNRSIMQPFRSQPPSPNAKLTKEQLVEKERKYIGRLLKKRHFELLQRVNGVDPMDPDERFPGTQHPGDQLADLLSPENFSDEPPNPHTGNIYKQLLFSPQSSTISDGLPFQSFLQLSKTLQQMETQRQYSLVSPRLQRLETKQMNRGVRDAYEEARLRQHEFLTQILTPQQYEELLTYSGHSLYPSQQQLVTAHKKQLAQSNSEDTKIQLTSSLETVDNIDPEIVKLDAAYAKQHQQQQQQSSTVSSFSSDGQVDFAKLGDILPPPNPEVAFQYTNQPAINREFGYHESDLKHIPLTSNFQLFSQASLEQYRKIRQADQTRAQTNAFLHSYDASLRDNMNTDTATTTPNNSQTPDISMAQLQKQHTDQLPTTNTPPGSNLQFFPDASLLYQVDDELQARLLSSLPIEQLLPAVPQQAIELAPTNLDLLSMRLSNPQKVLSTGTSGLTPVGSDMLLSKDGLVEISPEVIQQARAEYLIAAKKERELKSKLYQNDHDEDDSTQSSTSTTTTTTKSPLHHANSFPPPNFQPRLKIHRPIGSRYYTVRSGIPLLDAEIRPQVDQFMAKYLLETQIAERHSNLQRLEHASELKENFPLQPHTALQTIDTIAHRQNGTIPQQKRELLRLFEQKRYLAQNARANKHLNATQEQSWIDAARSSVRISPDIEHFDLQHVGLDQNKGDTATDSTAIDDDDDQYDDEDDYDDDEGESSNKEQFHVKNEQGNLVDIAQDFSLTTDLSSSPAPSNLTVSQTHNAMTYDLSSSSSFKPDFEHEDLTDNDDDQFSSTANDDKQHYVSPYSREFELASALAPEVTKFESYAGGDVPGARQSAAAKTARHQQPLSENNPNIDTKITTLDKNLVDRLFYHNKYSEHALTPFSQRLLDQEREKIERLSSSSSDPMLRNLRAAVPFHNWSNTISKIRNDPSGLLHYLHRFYSQYAPKGWSVNRPLESLYAKHTQDYFGFLMKQEHHLQELFWKTFSPRSYSAMASLDHHHIYTQHLNQMASPHVNHSTSQFILDAALQSQKLQIANSLSYWQLSPDGSQIVFPTDFAGHIERQMLSYLFPTSWRHVPQWFKDQMTTPSEFNAQPPVSWICERTDKLLVDPIIRDAIESHGINYPLMQRQRDALIQHYYLQSFLPYRAMQASIAPFIWTLRFCVILPLKTLYMPVGLAKQEIKQFINAVAYPTCRYSKNPLLQFLATALLAPMTTYNSPFVAVTEYLRLLEMDHANKPAFVANNSSHGFFSAMTKSLIHTLSSICSLTSRDYLAEMSGLTPNVVTETLLLRFHNLSQYIDRQPQYGFDGQLLLDNDVDLASPIFQQQYKQLFRHLFQLSIDDDDAWSSSSQRPYFDPLQDDQNSYYQFIDNSDLPTQSHLAAVREAVVSQSANPEEVFGTTRNAIYDLQRNLQDDYSSAIENRQQQEAIERRLNIELEHAQNPFSALSAGSFLPSVQAEQRQEEEYVLEQYEAMMAATRERQDVHRRDVKQLALDPFVMQLPTKNNIAAIFQSWVAQEDASQRLKAHAYVSHQIKQRDLIKSSSLDGTFSDPSGYKNPYLIDDNISFDSVAPTIRQLQPLPLILNSSDQSVNEKLWQMSNILSNRQDMMEYIHNSYINPENVLQHNLLHALRDNSEVVWVQGNDVVLQHRTLGTPGLGEERQKELFYAWIDHLKIQQQEELDFVTRNHSPKVRSMLQQKEKYDEKQLPQLPAYILTPQERQKIGFSFILDLYQRGTLAETMKKDEKDASFWDSMYEKYGSIDFSKFKRQNNSSSPMSISQGAVRSALQFDRASDEVNEDIQLLRSLSTKLDQLPPDTAMMQSIDSSDDDPIDPDYADYDTSDDNTYNIEEYQIDDYTDDDDESPLLLSERHHKSSEITAIQPHSILSARITKQYQDREMQNFVLLKRFLRHVPIQSEQEQPDPTQSVVNFLQSFVPFMKSYRDVPVVPPNQVHDSDLELAADSLVPSMNSIRGQAGDLFDISHRQGINMFAISTEQRQKLLQLVTDSEEQRARERQEAHDEGLEYIPNGMMVVDSDMDALQRHHFPTLELSYQAFAQQNRRKITQQAFLRHLADTFTDANGNFAGLNTDAFEVGCIDPDQIESGDKHPGYVFDMNVKSYDILDLDEFNSYVNTSKYKSLYNQPLEYNLAQFLAHGQNAPYTYSKVKQLFSNEQKQEYLESLYSNLQRAMFDLHHLEKLQVDGRFGYHPLQRLNDQHIGDDIHLIQESDVLDEQALFRRFFHSNGAPKINLEQAPPITARQREENQLTLLRAQILRYKEMVTFIEHDLITIEDYRQWCDDNYFNHEYRWGYVRVYHLLFAIPAVAWLGVQLYRWIKNQLTSTATYRVEKLLQFNADIVQNAVQPLSTQYEDEPRVLSHCTVSSLPVLGFVELPEVYITSGENDPHIGFILSDDDDNDHDLSSNQPTRPNTTTSPALPELVAIPTELDLFQTTYWSDCLTRPGDAPQLYKLLRLFGICTTIQQVHILFDDVYSYLQTYYPDIFPSVIDHVSSSSSSSSSSDQSSTPISFSQSFVDQVKLLWRDWFVLVTWPQHDSDASAQYGHTISSHIKTSAVSLLHVATLASSDPTNNNNNNNNNSTPSAGNHDPSKPPRLSKKTAQTQQQQQRRYESILSSTLAQYDFLSCRNDAGYVWEILPIHRLAIDTLSALPNGCSLPFPQQIAQHAVYRSFSTSMNDSSSSINQLTSDYIENAITSFQPPSTQPFFDNTFKSISSFLHNIPQRFNTPNKENITTDHNDTISSTTTTLLLNPDTETTPSNRSLYQQMIPDAPMRPSLWFPMHEFNQQLFPAWIQLENIVNWLSTTHHSILTLPALIHTSQITSDKTRSTITTTTTSSSPSFGQQSSLDIVQLAYFQHLTALLFGPGRDVLSQFVLPLDALQPLSSPPSSLTSQFPQFSPHSSPSAPLLAWLSAQQATLARALTIASVTNTHITPLATKWLKSIQNIHTICSPQLASGPFTAPHQRPNTKFEVFKPITYVGTIIARQAAHFALFCAQNLSEQIQDMPNKLKDIWSWYLDRGNLPSKHLEQSDKETPGN